MVRRVLAPVATLVVTVLAACQGDLTAPQAPDLTATSSLADAPRLARSPAANEVVPGQYLVVFRAGVADGNGRSEAKAAEKIARARKPATLKHTYSAVLKGFAAQLSDEDVAALRADPDVAVVEPDPVVRIAGSQASAPWGLDRIDQSALPLNGTYSYGNDGSGVTVYILDTGINTGHVEFGGRAVAGYDAITSGGGAVDCNGHGTHVAGTVGGATYGVAKNVRLVAVRVLDCSGNSAGSSLMAGMDYVTRQKQASPSTPMVANMSLVGAASSTFDQAVQNMINAGVTSVVAAGNSSTDACTVSPSRLPAAITVGASDQTDVYASFSNYGSCVDITAPGVVITSSYIGGTTATAAMSGTSMATPHVAGAAALYLAANRSATPSQVSSALVNNSVTGRLLSIVGGQANRLLSVAFLGGTITEPAPAPAPAPAPSVGTQTNLLSSATGLGCLEVLNGTNSAGVAASVGPCVAGSTKQTWTLAVTGSAGPMSAFGGAQCLDDWGGRGLAGDNLGTWTCVPSAATQTWTLTSAGQLKGVNGLCVQAPSSAGAQATLQVCNGSAAQQWTLGATSSAPAPAPAPAPSAPGLQTTALSSATGLGCLSIVNNTNAPGVAATVVGCVSGATGQTWTLPTTGSAGAMTVYSGAQCLDDWGGRGQVGDNLGTWNCVAGAPTQTWTLTSTGELKGVNGLCVQAPASAGAQATLQSCNGSAAQRWTPGTTSTPSTPTSPTTPTTRFTATLAQGASGLCLSIAGNQQANLVMAVLAPCANGAGQLWSVPAIGTPGAATVFSGAYCMDDWGGRGTAGDQIGTYTCVAGAPTQTWTLTSTGELRGVNNLCVGSRYGSTSAGAVIELQACTGAATQRWTATAAAAGQTAGRLGS